MVEKFDPYNHPATCSAAWWKRYTDMAEEGTDISLIAEIAQREEKHANFILSMTMKQGGYDGNFRDMRIPERSSLERGLLPADAGISEGIL